MKKTKKLFSVILAITILFSSATSFLSAVKAEPNVDYPEYFTKPTSMFEHVGDYLMQFYADNSTGNLVDSFRVDVPNALLVPIHNYTSRTSIDTEDYLQDEKILSNDTSFINGLSYNVQVLGSDGSSFVEATKAESYQLWLGNMNTVRYSLVDYLKAHGRTITDNDVTIKVDVVMPTIQGGTNNTVYNAQKIEYSISSASEFTSQVYEKIKQVANVNAMIAADGGQTLPNGYGSEQILSLTATTSDGEEYRMVLGKDNNWYLFAMTQKVIINYITNGGNPIDPIVFDITSVEQYNTTVTLVDAVKEGSKFIGWYVNEGLTEEAKIKAVIDVFGLENISTEPNTYEVNVYAKWSETTDNPKTGITNTLYISGAAIIASIGLIAIAKKKNLFKKI